MNILIYIPNISKEGGGMYQYSVTLLNILRKDTDNTYWIFNDYSFPDILDIVEKSSNFRYLKYEIKKHRYEGNLYYRVVKKTQNLLGISILKPKAIIEKICNAYKIDLIHCPYQNYLYTNKIPFITTMHDVQEIHFPEFFSSYERAVRAVNYKKAIEESTRVIVSYNHIKQDLLKYFTVDSHKIAVILLEMNRLWVNDFLKQPFLENNNLEAPEKFVLYPAATWHHKNHFLLLNAILELRSEGIIINLVCTGNQTKYFFDEILPFITSKNLENQVLFKGIVSDLELYSLYMRTRGVVIPSLYEAGSFPLYESIILNTPVICSNTTSLPETIGSDKFIFSNRDIASLKEKLIKLYFDDSYLLECKNHLKERLNWLNSLNSLNAFKSLYSSIRNNQ